MNEFAKLLVQFRISAGLSQKALAKQAGLDQSHLNRLERGLRKPPKKRTIIAIAEGLSLGTQDVYKLLNAAGYEKTDAIYQSKHKGKETETETAFHSGLDLDFQNNHPTIKAVKETIFSNELTPEQRKRIQDTIEQIAKWFLYEAKKQKRMKK